MATPTVVRRATAVSSTSNSTTFTASWTWGTNTTINSGDRVLWVVTLTSDGAPTSMSDGSGLGWTKQAGPTSDGTSAVTGAVFTLETTTAFASNAAPSFAQVTNASEQYSATLEAFLVSAGATTGFIVAPAATGSSTNSDPPSLTNSSGASIDAIVVATRSGDSTVVATVAPTDYANLLTATGGGSNGASTNSADRSITIANGASENPGTFTSVTEQWVSFTYAVYEVAGGPVTHATTGALTGQIGSVVGSAAHIAIHTSAGVLTGQLGSVSGSAAHIAIHPTSGSLAGQIGSVAGSAARTRQHATSGALAGQLGSVSGSAVYSAKHTTSGTLSGQIGSVAGSAARTRVHDTAGTPTGQLGSVSGLAVYNAKHTTTGSLTGQIGSVAGSADHATNAFVTHDASGALSGQLGSIDGAALRFAQHIASGSLVGDIGGIVGSAETVTPPPVTPLGWHAQAKSGSWTSANLASGTVWDEQNKSGAWSANSSTGGTVWNDRPKGNWN